MELGHGIVPSMHGLFLFSNIEGVNCQEAKKAKQDAADAKKAKGDDLLESLYGGLPPPDPKKAGHELDQAVNQKEWLQDEALAMKIKECRACFCQSMWTFRTKTVSLTR